MRVRILSGAPSRIPYAAGSSAASAGVLYSAAIPPAASVAGCMGPSQGGPYALSSSAASAGAGTGVAASPHTMTRASSTRRPAFCPATGSSSKRR
jgi:hypothetical protein